ncbi:MAG: putative selenium-dependent hydroxylase accessory protein YqeC [Oscillospiraceae bacterium]|nr:putative selenium-dependent hydroxylase accessory protein YqeC [Oscillospiraceae bacterium]
MDRLYTKLAERKAGTVIAAVGSGGKTSCLKAIARKALPHKKTVLLTTTTHMYQEDAVTDLSHPKQVLSRLSASPLLFAGTKAGCGKIGPLPDRIMDCLPSLADLILVEADGSRGLPMKIPADYEPALPPNTDLVLILFGLSALDKPLSVVCHRWQMAVERFGWQPDAPVSVQMAALALKECYLSPLAAQGVDTIVILNQADTVSSCLAAEMVLLLEDEDVSVISLCGINND